MCRQLIKDYQSLVEGYGNISDINILDEMGDSDYRDSMSMNHRKDAATTAKFKHSARLEIEKDEKDGENTVYNRNKKRQNSDKSHTGMSEHDIRVAKRIKELEYEREMWASMHNRKNKAGKIHQSIH